ncbi:hypothetical protein BD413DRAFT_494772 [Trametes elegans]|nr:hypothetical protein BD413DRAFT_494772 [Trametes elegans]
MQTKTSNHGRQDKRKRAQSSASTAPNQTYTKLDTQPTKKTRMDIARGKKRLLDNNLPTSSATDHTLPARVGRKHWLQTIDVDAPDSSPASESENAGKQVNSRLPKKPICVSISPQGTSRQDSTAPDSIMERSADARDSHYNDDGEDINEDTVSQGNDEGEEQEDPREQVNVDDLRSERVTFSTPGNYLRSLTPYSANRSGPRDGPPVTDNTRSGSPSADNQAADGGSYSYAAPPRPQRTSMHKERKLGAEMPVVREAKDRTKLPPASRKSRMAPVRLDAENSESDLSDHDEFDWKPRTTISRGLKPSSASKWEVQIKPVSKEMKAVMRNSFGRAELLIAIGDPDGSQYLDITDIQNLTTPFERAGVENICRAALIASAEQLGYDGELDVAHRLEHGSEKYYITLLTSYTAARARPFRAKIKDAATTAYASVVNLTGLTAAQAGKLHEGGNFLYPQRPNGDYNYGRPFHGLGIAEVAQAVFFKNANSIGMQELKNFQSSLASAPGELEIPEVMLAMTACVISAVIYDRSNPPANGKPAEFSGPALEGTFRSFLTILANLRVKEPVPYHDLMHDICMRASGGRAVNHHGDASQSDIVNRVDWANIGYSATDGNHEGATQ